MTTGQIVDESTRRMLADAGMDVDAMLAPEYADAGVEVAIIFDGAVDEWFILSLDSDWRGAAGAIADRLRADFPTSDVVVETSHVYFGEGFVEWSGRTDYSARF